jgi:hypothetical protein
MDSEARPTHVQAIRGDPTLLKETLGALRGPLPAQNNIPIRLFGDRCDKIDHERENLPEANLSHST